jgi:circadian clock protein KaiB
MTVPPRTAPARAKGTTPTFDRGPAKPGEPGYRLSLYVAGMTPRSARAIANIKEICEEHLRGRYALEVIDLYQQPVLAERDQIVAVPTLLKRLPRPLRRLIGDLSDRELVLVGLDLKARR